MIQNTILTSVMLIVLLMQSALAVGNKRENIMQETATLTISKHCEKLRQETGKSYEVIEAVLTKPGSILSASSTVDPIIKRTEAQLMAEWGTFDAIYENESEGIFIVGFTGTVGELLPFEEILYRTDQPTHTFCAYKADHPNARSKYIGNVQSLRTMEK